MISDAKNDIYSLLLLIIITQFSCLNDLIRYYSIRNYFNEDSKSIIYLIEKVQLKWNINNNKDKKPINAFYSALYLLN